eukprot:TRINITY_DN0_c0_g1_i2.p1 TRINITY_DN0_c0_g1~~TRINITY_DN0_c0_g1_i2.p1  ORF type:complete len:1732 (-),score=420.09 TRINITY_DN0_c0_g1_i2:219-5315(-)
MAMTMHMPGSYGGHSYGGTNMEDPSCCMRMAFKRYDTQSNGTVPMKYIERMLSHVSPGLSRYELQHMLQGFLTNYCQPSMRFDPESRVEYQKFIDWLFKPAQQSRTGYSMLPGLGDQDFPGFPVEECPQSLPDLSRRYQSTVAKVMWADQSLYQSLRSKRSRISGSTLARCIKPAMDQPSAMGCGIVAADEDCYQTFKPIFEQVIQMSHYGHCPQRHRHVTDMTMDKISAVPIDHSGSHVGGVRIMMSRNIHGYPFSPACDQEQRQQVESLLRKCFDQMQTMQPQSARSHLHDQSMNMRQHDQMMMNNQSPRCGNELRGEYHPFDHSKSGGMMQHEEYEIDRMLLENELDRMGLMFREPNSVMQLAAGMGRHWPQARGLYYGMNKNFVAWVNSEDHLCMTSIESHGNLQRAFDRVSQAMMSVEQSLRQNGASFAHDSQLGYLTTSPANLGTAMHVSVTLRLPLLSAWPDFRGFCKTLGLYVQPSSANGTMGGNQGYGYSKNQPHNGMGQQYNGMNQQYNGMGQQHNGMNQQYNGMGPQNNGMNPQHQQNNGMNQPYSMGQMYNGPNQQCNGMGQQYNGTSQQYNGMGQQYNGMNQQGSNHYNGNQQHGMSGSSMNRGMDGNQQYNMNGKQMSQQHNGNHQYGMNSNYMNKNNMNQQYGMHGNHQYGMHGNYMNGVNMNQYNMHQQYSGSQYSGSQGFNGSAEYWDVTNCLLLGRSEVDIINYMLQSCRQLVEMEKNLQNSPGSMPRLPTNSFSLMPGLGEEWYPGFSVRPPPENIMNMSNNRTILGEMFKKNGNLYQSLRDRQTMKGVNLAMCIKPGMDSPDSNALGLVAGDEECYETFRDVFDKVLQERYNEFQPSMQQPPSDFTMQGNQPMQMLNSRYVVSCKLVCSRNVFGFRFPPACDRNERMHIEQMMAVCFSRFREQEVCGEYLPLANSPTYQYRPTGMTPQEENELNQRGFLFHEPQGVLQLAAGIGRNWPEARGVFKSDSWRFACWVNEQDHMTFISSQEDGDMWYAFRRMCYAVNWTEKSLEMMGMKYARSSRLGYLTTSPTNIGTGLRATVRLRLPRLCSQPDLMETCRKLGVMARHVDTASGIFEVSNACSFGRSEKKIVESVMEACNQLIHMETGENGFMQSQSHMHCQMQTGTPSNAVNSSSHMQQSQSYQHQSQSYQQQNYNQHNHYNQHNQNNQNTHYSNGQQSQAYDPYRQGTNASTVAESHVYHPMGSFMGQKSPYHQPATAFNFMPGLGDEPAPGFSMYGEPSLPDMQWNQTLCAEVLRKDPTMYGSLKSKQTRYNGCFAACIKACVDNPTSTEIGAFACDEECYHVYRPFFDELARKLHTGFPSSKPQPKDLSGQGIVQDPIDMNGNIVVCSRVSCTRNLSGFKFSPTVTREERSQVENLLIKVHNDLKLPELTGKYYPIGHPNSNSGNRRGMSSHDMNHLAEIGFLFYAPQTSMHLSSGVGRQWPEGRGVFASDSEKFVSWFNQQDHLYMTAFQKDGNLRDAFFRLSQAHRAVERGLEAEGKRFAHLDRMGYLTTCPSNLGTGLHASVTMRLPMLSCQAGFKEICRVLELHATACPGESLYEMQNMKLYGQSEVEIVNAVIVGCTRLVSLEMALAGGGKCTRSLTSNFSSMLSQWPESASKALTEQRTEAFLRQACPGLQDKDLQAVLCTLPENATGDVATEDLMKWLLQTVAQLDSR